MSEPELMEQERDADAAFLEDRYPDPQCRRTVLSLLADAIDAANSVGADRWTLAFDGSYIRLHVGRYAILEMSRNAVWLALTITDLAQDVLDRLSALRHWQQPRFKDRPDSAAGYIACAELEEVLPFVHDPFLTFARSQATYRVDATRISGEYAAGTIDVIRSELGRVVSDSDIVPGLPVINGDVLLRAFAIFDQERRDDPYWKHWERDPTYRYAIEHNNKRYPVNEIMRIATGVARPSGRGSRAFLEKRGYRIIEIRPAEQVWLFQANPGRYNLAKHLPTTKPGDQDDWTVSRFRDRMQAGQRVLLWQSGSEAGIYAVGELTGPPQLITYPAGEAPAWLRSGEGEPVHEWRVPFKYTHILDNPIRKDILQGDMALRQLHVLRAPQGTNFMVTDEEWIALQPLLGITGDDLTTTEGRRVAFERFRRERSNRLMVSVRRRRAAQLRQLLALPDTITLDGFNDDVWRLESRTLLDGNMLPVGTLERRDLAPERFAEVEQALAEDRLELHGNYIWRPGSTIFSPRSHDTEAKLAAIQQAVAILNDHARAPLDKSNAIQALPGFGENSATGLVMVFHPDTFALSNQQSQAALRKLGFHWTSAPGFQQAASELRRELRAEDFIELDWFLYQLNQDSEMKPEAQIWWVNQSQTYDYHRGRSIIEASLTGENGQHVRGRAAVAKVRPGDILIHYVDGSIRAVSQAKSDPHVWTDSSGTGRRQVNVEYHSLKPIARERIVTDLFALNIPSGPINRAGRVNQSYLQPLGLDGLRVIVHASPDNTWPTYVRDLIDIPPPPPSFAGLLAFLHNKGLSFPIELVSEYILALQVKRFVILTGISGTGKTQLATTIAHYYQDRSLPEDNHAVQVVAVRPDWTDQRGLLGFYNPITQDYVTTPFLRFLLQAQHAAQVAEDAGRPTPPHFIILDEMNLARVEYYFADFLSCLESGAEIALHDREELENKVAHDEVAIPRTLKIPNNLFFTGTVNIDETTSMFSPKVLDRAFTIEFNHVDLDAFGSMPDEEELRAHPLYLRDLPASLLDAFSGDSELEDKAEAWRKFADVEHGELRNAVTAIHAQLARFQRHFGYRVANEIARFVNVAAQQAGTAPETLWTALDLAVMTKVLPKLSGTQGELAEVLSGLFPILVTGGRKVDSSIQLEDWNLESEQLRSDNQSIAVRLPRSAGKVALMNQKLRQHGFTAFLM